MQQRMRGMSLVEVLVSLGLMSTALTALSMLNTQTMTSVQAVHWQHQAGVLVTEVVSALRLGSDTAEQVRLQDQAARQLPHGEVQIAPCPLGNADCAVVSWSLERAVTDCQAEHAHCVWLAL